MHLSPIQRLATSLWALVVLAVPVAYGLAFADHTLPHDSVTIFVWLNLSAGTFMSTLGVLLAYYSSIRYGLWLGGWSVLTALSCFVVALVAWLVAQRWETLTAGTSDQYLVTMALSTYIIGYVMALAIQAAFVMDFHNPARQVRPWVRLDWQPVSAQEDDPDRDFQILVNDEVEPSEAVARDIHPA